MLLAVEGITNSGKTTLCNNIINDVRCNFVAYNPNNIIHNNIKKVTHDKCNNGMFNANTELFLYLSILGEKTNQILKSKENFLMDRYALSVFSYFTSRYSFDCAFIDELLNFATSGIIPDITVFIDVPFDIIISRARLSPLSRKDLELSVYFDSIRTAYFKNISRYSKHFVIVDGTKDEDSIKELVVRKIQEVVIH